MTLSVSIPSLQIGSPALPAESPQSSSRRLLAVIVLWAGVLLVCSSVRHYLHRSGAFDLGFFDQAVYLISQGQTPISSLHGFHVLGDHASLILYPLAVLYWIWPDPHMLLAVQALALAGGAYPVWRLALLAGLHQRRAMAAAVAYLMYPLVLTANLFDFHPDVFLVPALLFAVLAARENRRLPFVAWVLLALSCKEILSLTVAGMGLWLLICERRRFFGVFALLAGAVWFVVSIKLVIPYFGAGRDPSGSDYYAWLGSSLGEMLKAFIFRPGEILARLLSLEALKYLLLVLVPVIWGLHYRTLLPLLAAAPAVVLNLLSDMPTQRSPFYQYSLPVVPFLFVAVIQTMQQGHAWIERARTIVAWSAMLLVIGFVARVAKLSPEHAFDWESLGHTRLALSRIEPNARVLTTFESVPQLSQRATVQYIGGVRPLGRLDDYDYILLNTRHSSVFHHDKQASQVLAAALASPAFHAEYLAPDVYLFRRIAGATALAPTVIID